MKIVIHQSQVAKRRRTAVRTIVPKPGLALNPFRLLPSSAQAPAKPSWAEVSLIISLDSRPAGRPA